MGWLDHAVFKRKDDEDFIIIIIIYYNIMYARLT